MTAIEFYAEQEIQLTLDFISKKISDAEYCIKRIKLIDQAKEMESKQLFLASKTLAKEAYESGQQSMYCGCYDIDGCTNYEEWLYEKFKSE